MATSMLVPLDGSKFAEQALPAALELARRMGARLHLVRAHEFPLVPAYPEGMIAFDPEWDRAVRGEEEEYLRSVANRCMEAGVSARTDLLDGPAANALAGYAQEMGVDLIVMTTHGRGGISRAWVGSVADALVRRSSVPVLLLRPRDDGKVVEGALAPRHVLIPLDGSRLSTGILDPAIGLGAMSKARYTLLRVGVPVPLPGRPLGVSGLATAVPGTTAQAVLEAEEELKAGLETLAQPLRARGLEVDTAVVMHTVPAIAILDWAAQNAVDLIALATHGRGGWSRVALGSVADKVMRGTQLPVLLYRPPATVRREAAPAVLGGARAGD